MKVSLVFVLWKNNKILKKSIQNKHERLKHEDLGPEKSSKFSKPENLLYIICQSRTTLTSVPGNSSRQWIIHFSSSHIKATEIITSLGVKRHEFINSLKRCLIQNYAKLHVSLVENSNGNYARGHASKAAIFSALLFLFHFTPFISFSISGRRAGFYHNHNGCIICRTF